VHTSPLVGAPQLAQRANIPANAKAVVLNLTAAEARGEGFVTAYPCGNDRTTSRHRFQTANVSAGAKGSIFINANMTDVTGGAVIAAMDLPAAMPMMAIPICSTTTT
jgi:hypothetical protein